MLNLSAERSRVFATLLGLIVGSFLNVIVVRLPNEMSIAWPGSHCPKCKARIRWWDNVPVLSYLILRGKCRSCKARISARYPVIELLTALLFLTATIRFGLSLELLVRDLPFLALLVAVTFIDLEHRIIPDPLSLGGLGLGLATSVVFTYVPSVGGGAALNWQSAFLGAALGFGLFYGLAWVYQRITGRAGLGGGDVKLLAMMGSFLGITGIFSTILISSVFGSIVGIVWGLIQRRKGGESLMLVSIPYGPFLVIGGLYHYFLGDLLWLRFMTPI